MAIFLCIGIGLKDIVHNVPPGVIDSPGLCDIDLAKTCKNNSKQEQQQQQEEEEEEEEEEDKEQERIEQGEQ